jgi:endonuclease/exonuclease/phosphatase family metal-dependent hydrolase
MLRRALIAFLLPGCAGPPPPALTPAPAATWRVATYNIHHGRGSDERVDLERIADVLRRMDPDVVALQEVDERVERSGGVDQAARLGALLGMSHAFGSFMDYQGGRYGMAILSHCRIRRTESVRLPDGNEPRVALVAELAATDGTGLTVIDVHFDWVADDGFRFAQAIQVAHYLDRLDGRWMVIGDFNDQPGSRTLDLFHERATEAAKPRERRLTFPADDPQREIDFIFAGPDGSWTARSVQVVPETVASDHRPVLALLDPTAAAVLDRADAAPGVERARACPR